MKKIVSHLKDEVVPIFSHLRFPYLTSGWEKVCDICNVIMKCLMTSCKFKGISASCRAFWIGVLITKSILKMRKGIKHSQKMQDKESQTPLSNISLENSKSDPEVSEISLSGTLSGVSFLISNV